MNEIIIRNHEILKNSISDNITFKNNTLSIPDNTILEETIKITLLNDNNEEINVEVGKNSNLKILFEIEDDNLSEGNYLINLKALENSYVNYLLIAALESSNANIIHNFSAYENSTIKIYGGLVSNVLTTKLNCLLEEKGAHIDIKTVAVSSDDHDQKIDVFMHNKAPNTYGYMTNIGIANKRGRVILNGIEKIEKGMKNSDVYQTLKGVITSDLATVEVNPILLINEYDLAAAGHAATVGKLDEESLYYLQSRGLTKEAAEKLIINGFLRPIIDEIEDENLKEKFINLVDKRI